MAKPSFCIALIRKGKKSENFEECYDVNQVPSVTAFSTRAILYYWKAEFIILAVKKQVGVLLRISLSATKYSVSCQNPSCKYCSLKGGATWVVNWYNLSESLVDSKTTSSCFNELFEISASPSLKNNKHFFASWNKQFQTRVWISTVYYAKVRRMAKFISSCT